MKQMQLPELATVAILGVREGADVYIAGTGVMIGHSTVLTARHVVQGGQHAKYYRVFSQAAGIVMASQEGDMRNGVFQLGDDLADLALLHLRHGHSGVRIPPLIGVPNTAPVTVIGVGGNETGLFETRHPKVKNCEAREDGFFCLEDTSKGLGSIDSGSPVLTQENAQTRLAGVYVGGWELRVSALDPWQEDLTNGLAKLEGLNEDAPEWSHVKSFTIPGHVDHAKSTTIEFGSAQDSADLVVVSVNSVGLPKQEYIPDLELRLFRDGHLLQARDQPSQIQSIRRESSEAGPWEVEIRKDPFDFGRTKIQFTWSLFEREGGSPRGRRARRS